MKVNRGLSLERCWELVNRIQLAATPEETRMRAWIAEKWLRENTVISTEDYNELMRAIAYLVSESYHMEQD